MTSYIIGSEKDRSSNDMHEEGEDVADNTDGKLEQEEASSSLFIDMACAKTRASCDWLTMENLESTSVQQVCCMCEVHIKYYT